MKSVLLAGVCLLMFATPSLACRGTAEYPEAFLQLARADLPDSHKAEYKAKLEEGETLHRRGHELDDVVLRKEALKILDDIKAKIAP